MALALMQGRRQQSRSNAYGSRSTESPMDIEWKSHEGSHLYNNDAITNRKRTHEEEDQYAPMQLDTPLKTPYVEDVSMIPAEQESPLVRTKPKRRRWRGRWRGRRKRRDDWSSSSDDDDNDNDDDDDRDNDRHVEPKTLSERAANAKFNFTIHHHHAVDPYFGVNHFVLGPSSQNNSQRHPYRSRRDVIEKIPHTGMDYLRLGIAFVGSVITVWAVYLFIVTLRRDVEVAMFDKIAAKQSEIASCAKHYYENRCDPESRIPMAEQQCRAWELCMNQKPTSLGTMRIFSETLAQVVNGFVDEVSWKVIFCVVILGAIFTYSMTTALAHFSRNRRYSSHESPRREGSNSRKTSGSFSQWRPSWPFTPRGNKDESVYNFDRMKTPSMMPYPNNESQVWDKIKAELAAQHSHTYPTYGENMNHYLENEFRKTLESKAFDKRIKQE